TARGATGAARRADGARRANQPVPRRRAEGTARVLARPERPRGAARALARGQARAARPAVDRAPPCIACQQPGRRTPPRPRARRDYATGRPALTLALAPRHGHLIGMIE